MGIRLAFDEFLTGLVCEEAVLVHPDSSSLDPLLLPHLRTLVARHSVTGDDAALDATASVVASLMRECGLQVSIHPTEGAPIIIGQRAGASKRHILFYDHYDVPPPGPWRDWHHEPFIVAEREGRLYGRGVAADKGNLVARLTAVTSLIAELGELPCNVTFLVEGDALVGSPYLPNLVADQAHLLKTDLVFSFGGILDGNDVPYLYAGVRGRLLAMLRVIGSSITLPADLATSVVNPAWRLLWALNRVKSDGEEVLIDGFYDGVVAPSREANKLTRALDLDEAARLEAWGLKEFLFGMSGATLARAETFTPTCNVSGLTAHTGIGPNPTIPTSAEALLDFSLVPEQRPNEIARLLREHLAQYDLHDVQVETLKGAYPPATNPLSSFALTLLGEQIEATFGIPPQVAPLAPFSLPLHLFTAGMNVPALPLGLQHPASAVRGPNESVSLEQLRGMTRLVRNLIIAFAKFDNIP
jgi:acetylornithine deacetylase/succinyl-diaminopimelate desuccinylase-like protein